MRTHISFICILLIIYPIVVLAVIRYVPSEYATIQSAINVSVAGDSVIVAPGVYSENIIWPQTDGITLKSAGNRLNTIINGNQNGRCLAFIGAWTNPVITTASVVDGFTLKNGYTAENGAGIICYYSSPTILNCLVAYNEAYSSGSGGGLYCYNASPVLTDVIFAFNIAYSGGGAHIDPLSSPVFNNCVFADNTLNSPGGSFAAGIYGRYQVYFQLNQCTITRNFYNNKAAIHLGELAVPIIQNSTIIYNDYGILIVHDGGINIQNCNIQNSSFAGLWHNDTDGDILNLQSNWWGSATGPYHETNNPNGLGDTVIGLANISNWLTAPAPNAPPIPPYEMYIDSFDGQNLTVTWDANPEPDIDHYEFNYGPTGDTVFFENTINVTTPSVTVPFSQGEIYFQARAVKSGGVKGWFSNSHVLINISNDDNVIAAPVKTSAYPNPFRESISIRFESKTPSQTELAVYNIKGELVRNIFSSYQKSGLSVMKWDGTNNRGEKATAGVYFIRLKQNNLISNSKVLLLR
ncbi:MAG: T9SS type A sorting domain-containing protein [Candidatus Cloacimonetes bacterium]|nr:T9SS type A sorting domain-containing protein [Candidatus Cloacimonadota bacterium]